MTGLDRTQRLADFIDCAPAADDFRSAALRGLSKVPKEIPAKYFYDERGSRLFEEICALDEYYPTRAEFGILRTRANEIAAQIETGSVIIELGSGSSQKVQCLLDALDRPRAYVPIDISRDHLLNAAYELAADYDHIDVIPVCADFVKSFELPCSLPTGPRVVFFPGSTIGNFHHDEATDLLCGLARQLSKGDRLLIGVDLKKDPHILRTAYNDQKGITAAFNLNLLTRMNRELEASFDMDAFVHRADYNMPSGRIEMHLVSTADQTVTVADRLVCFQAGESIHTENSYKYSVAEFQRLAMDAGFTPIDVWTDEHPLFSVHLFEVAASRHQSQEDPRSRS
ncbi:MAG: L-histidine N(alpha)-methyltransferase [Hyphomicrobiales bacterium]|nr:L-histidine N(alpha)-methyltransferase [Hyphomicrobiales bacterium]